MNVVEQEREWLHGRAPPEEASDLGEPSEPSRRIAMRVDAREDRGAIIHLLLRGEQLHPGPERRRLADLPHPSPRRRAAAADHPPRELLENASLADAGLAGDEHDAIARRDDIVEQRELAIATEERHQRTEVQKHDSQKK